MKRSALVVAALAAAVAAILVVGVGGASGSAPPSSMKVFVSIGDGQATEGIKGPMHITVQRAFGTSIVLPFDLYWSTVPGSGTATQGFDYAAQNGEYENLSGSIDCMVGSIADNIYEPDRTFQVHIWSPDPWVVITRDTGTFTIQDDDPVPTVSIGNAPTVTEGQDLVYPITLSNPSYRPVSVNVDSHAAGTSANWDSNDLAATPAAEATVPAYDTESSFVIQTEDDNVYEGSETVVAKLTSATNAIGTSTGTGIVNDNDPMPIVHIANADPYTVHHGHALNFALTLDRQSQLQVTVVNLDRYLNVSFSKAETVTFAPMVTSATYSYTVPSLLVAFTTLHLTGATNATLPGGAANYATGAGIW